MVAPPGTKGPCPPLARLAVGPGTKATPKGSMDKWAGTKACSVVVKVTKQLDMRLGSQGFVTSEGVSRKRFGDGNAILLCE